MVIVVAMRRRPGAGAPEAGFPVADAGGAGAH
jgi:hypothetical protein